MNTYSFNNIKNVYVLGDCHGEFKTYFHAIKNGIDVHSEDEDAPHPKELERRARKAAREQAMRNAARPQPLANGNGRRGYVRFAELPHDNNEWATFTTASLSNTIKKMKKSKNDAYFSNSLFIIAGDCGIGFNKPKYYEDLFGKFNKILAYNNTYIIMVRGNHDDPSYFDGKRINLSNIKAVPDYSVINANDKSILCVGGAISLDRTWRIKQEERINRFSTTKKKSIYWKDEAPVFNKEAIDEIAKSIKIDYVVSHSAPSFVNPENHVGIDEWSVDDSTLISDIKEERKVLDKVFESLRDNDMKPKYWAYGHFDYNYIEKRSDTLFRGLGDGFNPISIAMDIEQFFYNEEMHKKKSKEKKKENSANLINTADLIGADGREGGENLRPIPGGIFRNDPMMYEVHENEGDVEAGEELEMEEDIHDPAANEEIRGGAEFDDAPFNMRFVTVGNEQTVENGRVEEAQEPNNTTENATTRLSNPFGDPVNIEDLQRIEAYNRLRREVNERYQQINANVYYGNIAIDYPGIYTATAVTTADNNANGVNH